MTEPILTEPAAIFLTIMAVVLITPLLSQWARLPGIVGLIIGGIIVGEHGFNLLATGPIIELFGSVGLIYLMFNAGLEIDLDQFRQVRNHALVFAALGFFLGQSSGVGIGLLFGLGWAAAVLLGATYASQTLVSYSILSRFGILSNQAVAVTVGGTIFTDVASLLVLGVISGTQDGGFSITVLVRLVLLTIGFAFLILYGIPRLGQLFFRRFSGTVIEFQFVLVVLFVGAVLAEWIGMHTIVGAFLAGLAVNSTLSKESKVIGQVLFLGESFFVPLFLVSVGMRLDPLAVVANTETLILGLTLTAAVLITKFLAAWITARLFNYSWAETLTSWGLSQAQAAATLATVLVGTEIGLFTDRILNASILMILITSISSPFLVERFGKRLKPPKEEEEQRPEFKRIMVPVFDDESPENVLNLASLLSRYGEGELLILNLAENSKSLKSRREKLEASFLKDPETDNQVINRIETEIVEGILREAVENETSMICMEWVKEDPVENSVFNRALDGVIWEAKVPVIAVHLITPINALERVVLIVAADTVGIKFNREVIETSQSITEALDLNLTVLATDHYLGDLEAQLSHKKKNNMEIIPLKGDLASEVSKYTDKSDLLVLPSMGSRSRFRPEEGHLPYRLIQEDELSVMVIHH